MKEVLSKIDQSLNFLPIGRFYDRGFFGAWSRWLLENQ